MWCWWQTLVRRVVAADRAHSRLTFSHYQVGSSVGRARGAYDILDYDLMPKHARHGLYRAPDRLTVTGPRLITPHAIRLPEFPSGSLM
jgi:hypothetical protein